jgi:hypothetical protein
MSKEQPEIPGLEGLERGVRDMVKKRQALCEEIQRLGERVLALELEVSLLRIQLEKGEVKNV